MLVLKEDRGREGINMYVIAIGLKAQHPLYNFTIPICMALSGRVVHPKRSVDTCCDSIRNSFYIIKYSQILLIHVHKNVPLAQWYVSTIYTRSLTDMNKGSALDFYSHVPYLKVVGSSPYLLSRAAERPQSRPALLRR